VLRKAGELTDDELTLVKRHTEIGHRMLAGSGSPPLELAATIALHHHENFDGSGYPRGLAGEQIPIEGRIVRIADVFDTMVSRRPYRGPVPVDQAIARLRALAHQFDPRLLEIFFQSLDEILLIRERHPEA
jgi:putative two-component system response regulator